MREAHATLQKTAGQATPRPQRILKKTYDGQNQIQDRQEDRGAFQVRIGVDEGAQPDALE